MGAAKCMCPYFCCVELVFLGLMIAIFTNIGAVDETTEKFEYGTLTDLVLDWQTGFVEDIKVFDKDDARRAPEGYEPLFTVTFPGSYRACNCLGIFSKWIEGENMVNMGDCSNNQTVYGCSQDIGYPSVV